MAGDVAFVIPVLNEGDTIASCLAQLRQQLPTARLVVVDGGSDDDTVELARPHCNILLEGPRGRARQMNQGAAAADADYLFFLHADTRLELGPRELEGLLDQAPRWGFFKLRLSGDRWPFRVIEGFINARSRLTSIGTGDQVLFARRDVFAAAGGFDDIPLMEDVALCKRLRAQCRPHIASPAVVTSSRRWEEGGIVRTVLLMWSLRLGYFFGVSPARLWRYYYGR